MSSPTITEFLLARIAEDEAQARRGFSHPRRWVIVAVPGMPDGVPNGISCTAVLAECRAKRAIVEQHQPMRLHPDQVAYGMLPRCSECGGKSVRLVHPCPTLRILAAVYVDHPDYQQEWTQ